MAKYLGQSEQENLIQVFKFNNLLCCYVFNILLVTFVMFIVYHIFKSISKYLNYVFEKCLLGWI